MAAYMELKRHGGPWKSKYEAVKSLSCASSNGYNKVAELISKGYLLSDPKTKFLTLAGMSQELKQLAEESVAKAKAKETARIWLDGFLPGAPSYKHVPL